jgi:acyl transferase domain-containing protein/thioesterase domain-containing protein
MTDASDTSIAIVGLGLRVPGAKSAEDFWRNVASGVESIRRYTEPELVAAGERLDLIQRPNYVKAGAPLDGMALFDGEFFGFSPKESAILDPQHRHFMECAWEALEDAGHVPERFNGAIGVFAGCGMGSYFYFNLCTRPDLVNSVGMFLLRHTGNDKDFLATRVSYLLNLRGPSINVQTACSTSLVAVHYAAQSLLSGECDMALAGGVTIELPHQRGYLYQEREILSPDGKCHAFDHRAQGTVFGSGVGVAVLRRLNDAVKDGDHIYAVIRGSAVNNDGGSKAGYLAPSVDGQAAAVAEALAVANLSADDIDYVECHGTGTYLGDPIEIAALTQAFRESSDRRGYCRVGSVKSNIGHLDTAAGIASLAKVSLALKHGQIPPSLNFEKPNPTIDFENSPFRVAERLTDWPRGDEPRRASVNSLGVGGTNAHVVLEEAPKRPPSSPVTRPRQILCLSARNVAALDDACRHLAEHLERHPELALGDVSYSLLSGRREFQKRRVLACQSTAEAVALLRERDQKRVFTHSALGERANVVFMFPGGGAQYVGMAKGLYDVEPSFKQSVDRGLDYLRQKVDYDPRAILFAEGAELERAKLALLKPSVQLPLIFIVEYALAQLWMSLGIVPSALIGHSLGENTAAAVSEVMSFEDTLGLVLLRGQLFDGVPAGGMLSVPLAAKELEKLLPSELDIACVNGPELTVASGPQAALAALAEALLARGVEAQRIPIDIAAHSRMLLPILEPFKKHLSSLKLSRPKIPFASNRTGALITDAEATSPSYWVDHLRHTVRFAEGIALLAQDTERVFLEVGPGRTLGSLAKQISAVKPQNVLASLRHQDEVVDDATFFATVHGRLWALGIKITEEALWPNERRLRVPLPTYAFQHQYYWIEPGKAVASAEDEGLPMKELDPERWFFRPSWRQRGTEPAEASGKQTWLMFLDEAGVGTELAARLEQRGDSVIRVREGDAFYKLGEKEYVLSSEQGLDGYEALVRELLASAQAPSRILHLWLLTDREEFRPGSSFFHRNQERGFFSLLFLAQALGGQDYPGPAQLTVVTSGMQRVRDEALPYPEKATALGPALVMSRELPQLSTSVVDVQMPRARGVLLDVLNGGKHGGVFASERNGAHAGAGAAFAQLRELFAPGAAKEKDLGERLEVVEALFTELLGDGKDEVVALRKSGRWVRHYERTSLPQNAAEVGFRRGHTYLITGGLGGIGLTLAAELAQSYKARLVLVGRTPLPARQDWQSFLDRHPNDALSGKLRAVLDLEAKGAEVLVAAADVTNVERMREVLTEAEARFGQVHGVIHAAGVLRDQPILGKPQGDIDAVFAPKVYGTMVLLEALGERPLDFLLLFSSTSAATAPAGQVDYVAANAFLNATAASFQGSRRRCIALGWGVWRDVGMAASAWASAVSGEAPQSAAQPAPHPLFDEQRVSRTGKSQLLGRWSTATHWVLDEHRTADRAALLPGTGYLELARAAVACLESAPKLELQDVFFFSPLHVPDGQTRKVRVQVEPDEQGYDLEVSSASELDGVEAWERHAQAKLSLVGFEEPEPLDIAAIEARCGKKRLAEDASGIQTGQEDHLHFGPRWRVLRRASFGEREAIARLELPESFRHDLEVYALHPALLDLATGYAMDLVPNYDRRLLWVPLSYKKVRMLAPLPARIWSWVRLASAHGTSASPASQRSGRANGPASQRLGRSSEGFVSFDVVITDDQGNPCVVVEGFTIKRLDDAAFVGPKPDATLAVPLESPRHLAELSPGQLAFQHTLSQGILPNEGRERLERVLGAVHDGELIVSSLDLGRLRQQARGSSAKALVEGAKFSRPQLDSSYVAPKDDIERTLADFWQELLGVEQVGVQDSFFDLGGHSLVAVRLFAKIKKTYRVDYPISVLFEAPTIEQCAALLRNAVGAAQATSNVSASPQSQRNLRYLHLVKMHQGDARGRTPFFLCAGMFGNVLNLRHLAHLIGSDRPCYGLQARGLYGDTPPHETFEEMARDYLEEIRTVQPRGPYLLGGFSGGGIAAYELARQLLAAGEEVSQLVMLDTPLPRHKPLTPTDKLMIRLQDLKRQKAGLLLTWARDKVVNLRVMKERQRKLETQVAGESHDFHSQVIEAAFYRALERYEMRPLPLTVALFRPRLHPVYFMSDGRQLDDERQILLPDNGWGQYVNKVEVQEVPGDHDSMVLEPNVRVLAAALARSLERGAPGPRQPRARANGAEMRVAVANGTNSQTHEVARAG